MISRDSKVVRSGQAGFTLIELAVALGVTAIVMLGILFLFDFNNKLTRVQSNVADMQQSLRIAQYDMVRMARMAGRGGITAATSVVISDNVADGTLIDDDDEDSRVLAGTDILTVRGAFTLPIYQVAFTKAESFTLTGTTPTPASAAGGIIQLCDKTPAGAVQALSALDKRILEAKEEQQEHPEMVLPVVLINPLDDRLFVVVSVDLAASRLRTDDMESCPPAPDGTRPGYELVFTIERGNGAPNEPHHYGPLSPESTADAELGLSRVAFVGLLDRYSFYIKEDRAVSDDPDSELKPVLCRATFIGDTVVEPCEEIADGVLDLQVALGLDTSNDGTVSENPANPSADEWIGNANAEIVVPDVTDPAYRTFANLVNNNLKSLRISTLVRTRRPDNTFEAEDLSQIENHTYSLSAGSDLVNGTTARKYRRRLLQTLVNLRNLTS